MPLEPRELTLPDTRLVAEARALVEAALPRAFVEHSLRACLLGRAFAARRAIAFDEEDLALAALFHDTGLFAPHRDRRGPFTIASGRRLRAFLEQRSVARERIAPLEEAIELHMQLFPRWSSGPVAGLLHVGAWMDVTLRKRWSIWSEARAIAAAHPRCGLDWRFPVALAGSIGSVASCVGLLFPARYRDRCVTRERPARDRRVTGHA